MFGPTSSETRAPVPVRGRKTAGKPAVRFSPFASVPTRTEDADDTDLERAGEMLESDRPIQGAPTSPPANIQIDRARKDSLTARSPQANSVRSAVTARPMPEPGRTLPTGGVAGPLSSLPPNFRGTFPYRWVGVGIAVVATLLVALSWSECRRAPPGTSVTHSLGR